MRLVTFKHHENTIWIGSQLGYDGWNFDEDRLAKSIGEFQKLWEGENEWTCSVRISPTRYVCKDFSERGWEISVIRYPRFPKEPVEINKFTSGLAAYLLDYFEQNRISYVIDGQDKSINLLESNKD